MITSSSATPPPEAGEMLPLAPPSRSFYSSASLSSMPSTLSSTLPSLSPTLSLSTTPSSVSPPEQVRHRRPAIFKHRRRCSRTQHKRGSGEVAGSTLAECAAVFCCCPCAIVEIFLLTTVRFPAGLCRKAIKDRRLSRRKVVSKRTADGAGGSSLKVREEKSDVDDDDEFFSFELAPRVGAAASAWPVVQLSPAATTTTTTMEEVDEVMWELFSNAGFWRSPSKKDE